ncbi:MAG TPA: glutaredoxin [Hyalangium sp.]|nr:glutaredoxin [Hyalangium sp.]
MARLTLSPDKVAPAVQEQVATFHRDIVEHVSSTVARDKVVVVGMAQNPFVRRARKLLEAEGIKFTYIEYGSYLSMWKQRLALKLWAGFPTFPMVFIDGTLMGGFTELRALKEQGKLPK